MSSFGFSKSKESTIPGVLFFSPLNKGHTQYLEAHFRNTGFYQAQSYTHNCTTFIAIYFFTVSHKLSLSKISAWTMMDIHWRAKHFLTVFMPGQSLLERDSLLYPAAYTYKSRQKRGTQYGP